MDELQKNLDIFVRQYNEERSHGGYRTKGRAPLQTLREWIRKTLNLTFQNVIQKKKIVWNLTQKIVLLDKIYRALNS